MRHVQLVSVLVLTLPCSFRCAAQSPDAGTVEQTIMGIEKEMLDAALKGQPSSSEKYLADTYIFIGPDGMLEDKAQSISDLKTGALKLESASLDEAKVRVYGDTAIVTYASTDKGTYKGKDISGRTRWTDVFTKQHGQWQLVSSHGSRVME